LVFIRHWVLKRCRIIASIDLPVETFLAFGGTGTQTSVLVLQKKTEEEVRLEEAARQIQDYEVFMALCQTMGYDRRGNDLWLRTPEGEIIEQEVTARVITRTPEGIVIYEPKRELRRRRDDDVSQVASLFQQWWREKGRRNE
jgi:type I restriction enzyme M protein